MCDYDHSHVIGGHVLHIHVCVTMIMYVLYVDLLYMCDYDPALVISGPVTPFLKSFLQC